MRGRECGGKGVPDGGVSFWRGAGGVFCDAEDGEEEVPVCGEGLVDV